MPRNHPYLNTGRVIRRPRPDPITVAHPDKWYLIKGRAISFGSPSKPLPRIGDEIPVWKNGCDFGEEAIKPWPSGTVYYRFYCTPLFCGNLACDRTNRVLTNFPPDGWLPGRGFKEFGNPFDPKDEQEMLGSTFYINLEGQGLVWNEGYWGPRPANWGTLGEASLQPEQPAQPEQMDES